MQNRRGAHPVGNPRRTTMRSGQPQRRTRTRVVGSPSNGTQTTVDSSQRISRKEGTEEPPTDTALAPGRPKNRPVRILRIAVASSASRPLPQPRRTSSAARHQAQPGAQYVSLVHCRVPRIASLKVVGVHRRRRRRILRIRRSTYPDVTGPEHYRIRELSVSAHDSVRRLHDGQRG